MSFAGQKVAITGGSSGIGRAAALMLARQGASVAVLARGQARLDETLSLLEAAGAPGQRFAAVQVDVTDEGEVARAAAEVLEGLGGLDVLICNSGFARCAPTHEASLDSYHELITTNFFGHLHAVRAFLPHFRAQGSGHICLVTSMLGFMSIHGYGAYSASKYAVVGFAEALRQELLPVGVSVGVFYPPTTDTPGLASENEDKPGLTWALEQGSRKFTPEQVASAMLSGIRRRWFVSMAGVDSWAIYYLTRWAPWLVRWVVDRDMWAYLRKEGAKG